MPLDVKADKRVYSVVRLTNVAIGSQRQTRGFILAKGVVWWNWNIVCIDFFHAWMLGWFGAVSNLVWMSLIGVSLSSFSWVFAHVEINEPMPHFQFIFEFLRYQRLWFDWNMRNAFTFDSQVGVREKYVVKLKRTSSVAIGSAREVTKS